MNLKSFQNEKLKLPDKKCSGTYSQDLLFELVLNNKKLCYY